MMRSFRSALLLVLALASEARAADIYVSPTGGGDGSSATSTTTLNSANGRANAGDTVWLKGGTYGSAISPMRSGSASAWITYKAVVGELPIIDNANSGVNFTNAEYIVVDGVASRNNSNMGFTNRYTDMCSGGAVNNGHFQFKNVIAEGNGISGIAFFCATDLSIENAIVAHNGLGSSWSSGVNIYGSAGGPTVTLVRSVVAFENIDISDAKTDGSGFILDIGSQGALFQNNIGFRNGGSCFRVTKSQNAEFINNTCFDNSQYDQYGDEIFFSDAMSRMGAVVRNNILIPHSGKTALGNAQGVTGEKTITNPNVLTSTTGALDFHLLAGASAAIDQGVPTGAPATDAGFDPACIKAGAPTLPRCGNTNGCTDKVGFFAYSIDYEYIASVGGIAGCFKPGARSGNPDIGAYEYGASPAGGTGGAAPSGGAGVSGMPSAGGRVGGGGNSAGGSPSTAGGPASFGGTLSAGGESPTATGGARPAAGTGGIGGGPTPTPGSGGAPGNNASGASGTVAQAGGLTTENPLPGDHQRAGDPNGCGCRIIARNRTGSAYPALIAGALALVLLRRRRRALAS